MIELLNVIKRYQIAIYLNIFVIITRICQQSRLEGGLHYKLIILVLWLNKLNYYVLDKIIINYLEGGEDVEIAVNEISN